MLDKLNIPYFLIYGTLLGAVRKPHDIIPHTQDMDLVVDRRYWDLYSRAAMQPESVLGYLRQRPDLAEELGYTKDLL